MARDGGFWNYNEEEMHRAAQEVKKGTSLSTAARKHHVPRTTLRNFILKGPERFKKIGRNPVLRKSEEDILVIWITNSVRAGFPVTFEHLISSVEMLFKDSKRENEFVNGRPGRAWLAGFKKRNPSIATRVAQNFTATGSSVTDGQVRRWFDEMLSYFKESQIEYILQEPNRIFNADESAFFLNPKRSTVLASKGSNHVYQHINEKECTTVLICANADGLLGPPFVVFKYEVIPIDLVNSVPKGWGSGTSESGWMTCGLFYEYITTVYHPWLMENGIPRPVILFVDGRSYHVSLHTSQFCNENGIVLVALLPNATHLIQPINVAVFRSLKESWKNKVHEWSNQNPDNTNLEMKDFCPLLKQLLDEKVPISIIRDGFSKCGLYPWNPEAAQIAITTAIPPISIQKLNKKQLKRAIDVLEFYIGLDKLAAFKASSTHWTGCEEDKELFQVWSKMCRDVSSKVPIYYLPNPSEDLIASDERQPPTDLEQNSVAPTQPMDHNQLELVKGQTASRTLPPDTIVSSPQVFPADRELHHSEPGNTTSIIASQSKRSFLWPQPRTKSNKRELVPSAVTSDNWRKVQINKAKKKEDAEKLKVQRKLERLKKREEKDALKKQKASEKEGSKKKKTKFVRRKKKESQLSSSEEEDSWNPFEDSSDDASINSEENTLNLPFTLSPKRRKVIDSGNEEQMEVHSTQVLQTENDSGNVVQQNISVGDFALIMFSEKEKTEQRVCLVKTCDNSDELYVQMLCPCNHSKNIFALAKGLSCLTVRKSQVKNTLMKPLVFGSGGHERFIFPFSIECE